MRACMRACVCARERGGERERGEREREEGGERGEREGERERERERERECVHSPTSSCSTSHNATYSSSHSHHSVIMLHTQCALNCRISKLQAKTNCNTTVANPVADFEVAEYSPKQPNQQPTKGEAMKSHFSVRSVSAKTESTMHCMSLIQHKNTHIERKKHHIAVQVSIQTHHDTDERCVKNEGKAIQSAS